MPLLKTEKILRDLLSSGPGPHGESDFLRILYPGEMIWDWSALDLYKRHFSLMADLYHLQDKLHSEGFYLFVHFMRTWIFPIPEKGLCTHFNGDTGRFCLENAHEANLCSFHLTGREQILEELSLKYFYLDEGNINSLDAERAERFISGAWELLGQSGEVERSLQILELPGNSDLSLVKAKFRDLARIYHPDISGDGGEKFREINRAYRFLVPIMEKFR